MHIRMLATGGALVALIATAANSQTSPSAAHVFTGQYKALRGTAEFGIKPLGRGRYKVNTFWSVQSEGQFRTDGWEANGEARGNVLTAKWESWEPQLCKITFVSGKRPTYRLSGCGTNFDGLYQRVAAK